MPIAAIDVGTNTAKLVVAEAAGGVLRVLAEDRRFVRLGEGVDAARTIRVPALVRLGQALLALRETAHAAGATDVVVGATSASRDAANRDEVARFVRQTTGLDYTVLSGADEAALAFLGAVSAFPDLAGRPCTVVDIGGGSTEVVGGTPGGPGPLAFAFRESVDVGSVRVTERCFTRQPPPPDEVAAARAFVRGRLAERGLPHDPARTLVGAAGTTGSLARMHHGFVDWNDVAGAALTLTRADVAAWQARLAPLTFDETLALNPTVMHGRADIFLAGVTVLDEAMDVLGAPDVRVSPRGLRHGLALRALGLA